MKKTRLGNFQSKLVKTLWTGHESAVLAFEDVLR